MRLGSSARRCARLFFTALAALSFTAALAAATPALAQRTGAGVQAGPGDLGDVLFGRGAPTDDRASAMPHLARFRADTGDTFVLETAANNGPAFLKYDDSGEVWALQPTTGPRGDTIYKNDVGEAMLRTTRLGGMTVFTQDRPGGMAAAFSGSAQDLHNIISGPIAIFQVLLSASVRATHAAGHTVKFEAKELDPGTEAVFADAANLAAQAFVRVEHKGRAGRDALNRYGKVNFVNGRPPGVQVLGEEVRITVTPDLGFAGRPSSQRISQILFRR
jgi:hypothetical protein